MKIVVGPVLRKLLFVILASLAILLELAALSRLFNSNIYGLEQLSGLSSTYVLLQGEFSQLLSMNPLFLWVLEISLLISGIIIRTITTGGDMKFDSSRRDYKLEYASWVLCLSITGIVLVAIIIARFRFTLPAGGDNLWYIDVVRMMKSTGPQWAFTTTDRPLFYMLLYGLNYLVDVGSTTYWVLVAVISAVVFLLANLGFLVMCGEPYLKRFAPVILASIAVSTGFLAMSVDFSNSVIGASLLFLLFGLYLRSEDQSRRRLKQFALVSVSIALLLVYWYFFILALVGLGVYALLLRKSWSHLLVDLAPALVLLCCFIIISISYPPPLYWGIGSAISGTLKEGVPPWLPNLNSAAAPIFAIPSTTLILLAANGYDAVLFALFITGLVLLPRVQSRPLLIGLAMATFAGLGLMGSAFASTHAALLVPVGLISVVSVLSSRKRNLPILAFCIGLLLTLPLQTAVDFQLTYTTPLLPPVEQGIKELQWVSNHIGFLNRSYVLAVTNHYDYIWALAYGSALIYFGHIASAIIGKADPLLLNTTQGGSSLANAEGTDYVGAAQRLWLFGISLPLNTTKYHLIVTEHTYNVDFYERQFLKEIGPGVYELKSLHEIVLQRFATAWTLWKQTGNIDAIFQGTILTTLPVNRSNLWQAPNNGVIVHGLNNLNAVNVTLDVPSGETQYAVFNSRALLNLSRNDLLIARINISTSVQTDLTIVLQGSPPTFVNYFSYDVGTFSQKSSLQVLINANSLISHGNPSLKDADVFSINVFCTDKAEVTITLYELALVKFSS